MIGRLTLILALVTSMANASPVDSRQVEVLDGDTIRVAGETFRLVGFDAPETYRARCPSERELGNRATFRLRQLVAGGGLDLERIACSCRTGTQGTRRCNYGRSCGTLKARGQDVGATLVAEGLARAYVCGRTSCPSRESWCPMTQWHLRTREGRLSALQRQWAVRELAAQRRLARLIPPNARWRIAGLFPPCVSPRANLRYPRPRI
jgi:endonuclease YncB( thermonuclease family)